MKISELAKEVEVKPKTIRYYEQIGVLPRPPKAPNGYRVYTAADLRQLEFIRELKVLGFSLNEIKAFVPFVRNGQFTMKGGRLAERLSAKMAEVNQKIEKLETAREHVRRLLNTMTGVQEKIALKVIQPEAFDETCCAPFCGPDICPPAASR